MTAVVTRGDAAHLHLPDETVDLVVTSPPYFGLRSYQDGGEHYDGQVGDEATPAEYLDALTACTREWMRALKPGGSIFVNLGDKYAGPASTNLGLGTRRGARPAAGGPPPGFREKSLVGLPWRYAIRCVDELGLILRAEIVWAKPNGLPESVTDRVRRSHEQVFHFVKQPRYYSAVDEVREEHVALPKVRRIGGYDGANGQARHGFTSDQHPLGKLPGSVWTISTAPLVVPDHLGVDHFAAYPTELVRRIVLGWSPRDVCTACGEGRRPSRAGWEFGTPQIARRRRALALAQAAGVTADIVGERYGLKVLLGDNRSNGMESLSEPCRRLMDDFGISRYPAETAMGYAQRGRGGYVCACPDTTAPATPGVVLDPFGGTGTTALVASAYGRVGISVDLSADYCRLAQWRTTDPGQRARVLGVPKPEPVPDAQLGLFEGLTGGAL